MEISRPILIEDTENCEKTAHKTFSCSRFWVVCVASKQEYMTSDPNRTPTTKGLVV